VIASLIEQALARLRERVLSEADPVRAVEALVELRVAILDEHKGFTRVVFQTPMAEHGDASLALPRAAWRPSRRRRRRSRGVLERGIAAGVFVDVGATNLAVSLQGILNAFIAQWLREEPHEAPAERVAKLRATVLGLILRKPS